MTAVATLDLNHCIERISDGAYLRDLSESTGLDKRRLSEALRAHPDYPSAKIAAIQVQMEDAQKAIEDALNAVDIARAREQFRAAAWRAERECSEIWGQKIEQKTDVSLTVHVVRVAPDQLEQPAIEGSAIKLGVDLGVSSVSLPDKST